MANDDEWTKPAPGPPRATISDIELLSQSKLLSVYAMRTRHPMAEVLRPDYWSDLTLAGLRRGDLVLVVSDDGKRLDHAVLGVTAAIARDRILRVGLLRTPIDIGGTLIASEDPRGDRAHIN